MSTDPAARAHAYPGGVHGVVGRDRELALLDGFLTTDRLGGALLLDSGPGLGKSTLWEAGVASARRRGARVLASRPADAEATMAFAALIDLFDDVDSARWAALPAPQRQALDVALLREVATGGTPERHVVSVGLLNALRALSADEPLLVAIDDIQLIDPPSATALAFAARRLGGSRVGLLLAKRRGPVCALERAFEPAGPQRVELGPLSLGAVRHLLLTRLGLTLPRPLLRQVVDSTQGNPLFALEVGRRLVEDGLPPIGQHLPVPDAVEELLGTRVAGLRDDVRQTLLLAALGPGVRVEQLAEIAAPGSIDAAVEASVVTDRDGAVRASHPLVAAAAVHHAGPAERRAAHLALAGVTPERELRTRHEALAADGTDPDLASRVAGAAADSAARGAPHAAVELAEHALRLTPVTAPERPARALELAGYLRIAGEKRRLTELVAPMLDSLPRGATRARALLLLCSGEISGNDDIQRYHALALTESGTDARARADVLSAMAENVCGVRVERVAETAAWAEEALRAVSGVDPDAERQALYALAWARSLGGRPVDDVCERFGAIAGETPYLVLSPDRVRGQQLVWRGEVASARVVLDRLLASADERGEPSSYALQRLHLCELELRAGRWETADRILAEWAESVDSELLHWPMYERCRALLAAGRGLVDEGRRWAAEARRRAEDAGSRWDQLEAARAAGVVALLDRDPQGAVQSLRPVWEHTQREGVRDPGTLPVAPELVEALAELGQIDAARTVTERLGALAAEQQHAWGRVSARRCRGLVGLAETFDERSADSLAEAARDYARLGLDHEAARSLLSLGRAERRHKKWGRARETLERAAASFDELGSAAWAEAARSELSRVGARRPAPVGELTATERQVAALAAEGMSNKEIAQRLVVTVSTVEFHLSRTYAKLGIRSRAQIAGRLGETPTG